MERTEKQEKNEGATLTVQEKLQRMEEVKEILSREFIGIDSVAQGVLHALRSWYLYPEFQERPLVINLWGLTGVGKTSLVERLVELLNFKDRFYRFSMEKEEVLSSLKYTISKLALYGDKRPAVFLFDEFQRFWTKDQNGFENPTLTFQYLWDFLDTGKLSTTNPSDYYRYELTYLLSELLYRLKTCVQQGVQVHNGKVVTGKEAYIEIMNGYIEDNKKGKLPLEFVPRRHHENLFFLARGRFSSAIEITQILHTMDAQKTLDFLEDLLKTNLTQPNFACHNALIFVAGNLDELNPEGSMWEMDILPDSLQSHYSSLTLPIIKEALLKRFRIEQIARLGNLHFVYPVFGETEYRSLIRLHGEKLCKKFEGIIRAPIDLDPSLLDLVYRDGVIPSQGARSILSTLNRILSPLLCEVALKVSQSPNKVDRIRILCRDETLCVQFIQGNEPCEQSIFPYVPTLDKLQCPRKDDLQSLIAVHESGHAILSCYLLHEIPKRILSVTPHPNTWGLTVANTKIDYHRKGDFLNYLAALLGGICAEELSFGKRNVTSGSYSDIKRATQIASRAVHEWGWGTVPAAYHVPSRDTYLFVPTHKELHARVKQYLMEAKQLALRTLKAHWEAFLALSVYLADHSFIDEQELRSLLLRSDPQGKFELAIFPEYSYRAALLRLSKRSKDQEDVENVHCPSYTSEKEWGHAGRTDTENTASCATVDQVEGSFCTGAAEGTADFPTLGV